MTDFASLILADRAQPVRLIHLADQAGFEEWMKKRSPEDRAIAEAQRFDGKSVGAHLILPRGNEFEVVAVVKDAGALSPWCLAALAEKLPEGTYKLANGDLGPAGLGWLLAQHRFDHYRSDKEEPERGPRVLLTSEPARIDEAVRLAAATALVRDLVNTPSGDLGPAELHAAVAALAKQSAAEFRTTEGGELTNGFPLIAAVGRAASPDRAPRLLELEWGSPDDPRIAVIGKGVCFDSGGLDLKPASGMRLMKKDMGGAAHALALAQLIIEARLPVRLHLLIPAVENAVSGNAFRPGDVIKSRKGLFVEIDNTDAEGRLILADALDKAAEAEPELIVDFATLTGAARVALGPDLPALFVNDDGLAGEIDDCSRSFEDPLCRMPLWQAYEVML
jgi:leucyl aminopeptidase